MGLTGASARDARLVWLARGAWVLIAVCALGLLLNYFTFVNTAEDSCGAGGPENQGGHYGIVGWSWLPPGETCSYEVVLPGDSGSTTESFTLVTGGTWYLVSTVLLMVACCGLLISTRRFRRTTAPAGWYADPDTVTQVRFWDGTKWTDNVNQISGPE